MKILLFNIGYCKGFYGSIAQYILQSYRYLFTSDAVEKEIIDTFNDILAKEKPDLVSINEIGTDQIKKISYPFSVSDGKYGKESSLRNLPFFKNNRNAFFAKKKTPYTKRFLKNGTKKLLYEIKLPKGITLFTAHFSLVKSTRAEQFKEISALIKNKKRVIVAGDFNITSYDELKPLLTNLKLAGKGNTFPAYKPKEPRDLFLCSKNMKVHTKILPNKISDHLGVLLEL